MTDSLFQIYRERIVEFQRHTYIVPVPLHWLKKLIRGYNQSALIAKRLSKLIGIPYLDPLCRSRWTRSQTKLTRTKRKQNLKNVFKLKNGIDLESKSIILVDDVFTTGSTMAACTLELLNAGANHVDILALARG